MTVITRKSVKKISGSLPVLGALGGTVLIVAFFAGLFSYDPALPEPEPRKSGEVVLLLAENQKVAANMQRWFSVHDPSVIARSKGSASGELSMPERRTAGEPTAPDCGKNPAIAPVPEVGAIPVPRMENAISQVSESTFAIKGVPPLEVYPKVLADDVRTDWKVPEVSLPQGCMRFAADFRRGISAADFRYEIVCSTGNRSADLALIRHFGKEVQKLTLPVRLEIQWGQGK